MMFLNGNHGKNTNLPALENVIGTQERNLSYFFFLEGFPCYCNITRLQAGSVTLTSIVIGLCQGDKNSYNKIVNK